MSHFLALFYKGILETCDTSDITQNLMSQVSTATNKDILENVT